MVIPLLSAFASGLAGGFAEGALAKRNPSRKKASKPPAAGGKKAKTKAPKRVDPPGLAKAKRMATKFHGDWKGHVVAVSPKERQVSKYLVVAGDLEDYTYAPKKGSKRSAYKWKHESLDRGFGRRKGKRHALLAVDPATHKPVVVAEGAAVKFSRDRGFMG